MEKARSEGSWIRFWLLFFCGIAFAVSFFKIPPAMTSLMEYFNCTTTDAGLFATLSSLAGTIAALFMGAVQKKIGPKNMIIGGIVVSIVSIIIALLAPNLMVFFVSQFIIGIGFGFIQTGAPTLINIFFTDPAKRGMPNSIWAAWTGVGSLICFNGFTFITAAFGTWQSVWIFALIMNVIGLLVCQFGIRVDKKTMMDAVRSDPSSSGTRQKGSLNVYIILLVILFALFGFSNQCWGAFAPTYMQQACGMDMGTANFVASISTFVGLFTSLIIGVILNKVKNQPLVLLVCIILFAVTGCVLFISTDANLMLPVAILVGLFFYIVPPCLFTNMQWAAPNPQAMGIGFAALSFGAGLGGFPSSVTVGAIVDATGGWAMVTVPIAIVAVVAVIIAVIFAVKRGPLAKSGVPEGVDPATIEHDQDALKVDAGQ